MSNEQRVFDPSPRQAVVAYCMCDEIVVGEDEMKEMVDPVVVKDVDITQGLS
jgi:hypothetical protein